MATLVTHCTGVYGDILYTIIASMDSEKQAKKIAKEVHEAISDGNADKLNTILKHVNGYVLNTSGKICLKNAVTDDSYFSHTDSCNWVIL